MSDIDVDVRPSGVAGFGVFVLRCFRGGERIRRVNVIREITAESPLRPELGELLDHCSYPDGKTVLWGAPDRYLNHSCDPNVWIAYEEDSCYIVARRDIEAGEELRCDYNINIADGAGWPCNCGAARCRGAVAGGFFSLPLEWQREYRPFLAAWFVRRHQERVASLDREQ